MKRVGFDVSALDPTFKEHFHRGIGRYVRNLRKAFGVIKQDDFEIQEFSAPEIIRSTFFGKIFNKLPAGRITATQHALYPIYAGRNADFIHYTAHMDAPIFSPKPAIITVHDLIPHFFAELYMRGRSEWRFKFARKLEALAIKNAAGIIANSECTAKDVVNYLGVERNKIIVTHLGVDPVFLNFVGGDKLRFRERFKLPSDVELILYVGGIDRRKNIDVLLKAIAGIKSQNRKVLLLIAGKIDGDRDYPAFKVGLTERGIANNVIELGYLEDALLAEAYHAVDLFVLPSLYEGFGFPVLEALACGGVVVAANAGSLPEILPKNYQALFDPKDHTQLAKLLVELLDAPYARAGMADVGHKHARKFTWEATALATFEAYKKLMLQHSH